MRRLSWRDPRPLGRARAAAQSSVELAALFALLLPIVLGIVDLGRAYFAYDVLVHAVNEGARYGSIDRSTANVVAAVQSAAGSLAIASTDVTVACFSGSAAAATTCSSMLIGDTVQVGASVVFQPVTPLIGALLPGGTLTLGATSRRSFQ